MIGHIYLIVNNINGKLYVGKTYTTLDKRFKEHVSDSKKERNRNRPLYRAINKYGHDNFKIIPIKTFKESILEEKEKYYIQLFDTYNNGYNATLGGDSRKYLNISQKDILNAIQNNKSMNQAAKSLNIDPSTLKRFATSFNIKYKIIDRQEVYSKLTREEAINIKYSDKREKDLAIKYNVNRWVISKIRRNITWKDI